MARIKVAIYDADKDYRERFSDYLMNFQAEEMELSVFSKEVYFFEALNVEKYQLVILGRGYENVLAIMQKLEIPILILLEESVDYMEKFLDKVDEEIVYTSKYQSMDIITRHIYLLAEKKKIYKEPRFGKKKLQIIGVISPIHHEMQLLFSLLYAKNLGKAEKVLYLDLLEFSGFSEMFGERENDMGDAILSIRNEVFSFGSFRMCIYDIENFSYISPFVNPENLKEIRIGDMSRLLMILSDYTEYDSVVLNLGNTIKDMAELLALCSKIYSLQKRGYIFDIQKKQFFSYLKKKSNYILEECIEEIELPLQAKRISSGINLLEQLNWSEFGDFVRSKM